MENKFKYGTFLSILFDHEHSDLVLSLLEEYLDRVNEDLDKLKEYGSNKVLIGFDGENVKIIFWRSLGDLDLAQLTILVNHDDPLDKIARKLIEFLLARIREKIDDHIHMIETKTLAYKNSKKVGEYFAKMGEKVIQPGIIIIDGTPHLIYEDVDLVPLLKTLDKMSKGGEFI